MTQDERWMKRYNEVKSFIETNHRNPSRHRIEEHDMLNWMKHQRKLMNAGEMKLERVYDRGQVCHNSENWIDLGSCASW